MPSRDESHTNLAGEQIGRAPASELRRGTVLAGRYQIETVLGQGGAGLVLRAFDRELREIVAIKVLRPELGSATRWIERLAREVKLARQIRHPNVCRVFDFEKAEGHFFIVMELASGGTLRREIEDGTLLSRPLKERLADARAVAAGLAAIHHAGIAHRDVTPQNVLRMADGHLVVSDFGLATEVSQTTTSIHGGTIAYMAPEVVRGERASFTSDVWSLGVVIHEIVFGKRPSWSRPVGGAVLTPSLGRPLAPEERRALEVCRACTADLPERRPRSAAEVAASFESGAQIRTSRRRMRRLAFALAVLAAAGALIATFRHGRSAVPATDARDLSDEPSHPADLSRVGRVLATIDDRLRCLKVLPDGETARFVWGYPSRSEDIDLRTGQRTRSPLVPEAYREGCAELSPDGKRLAFEGYTPDGRPFIYLSEHSDGRGAVPIVAATDPSMSSEPKWLPDGRAFTFDVDHQRMGLFSLDTRRMTVLPEAASGAYVSSTRFVIGRRLFIAAGVNTPFRSEFVELGLPFLNERSRFIFPGYALDVASPGDQSLFVTGMPWVTGPLWKVDLARHTRQSVAEIPGQMIRYPTFTKHGLLLASLAFSADVWQRDADGVLRQLTRWGDVSGAAPCGHDLLVARVRDESSSLLRLNREGRVLQTLSTNTMDAVPGCSPDGRQWFLTRMDDSSIGLYRCDDHGCDRLTRERVADVAVSPDGTRLAFIQPSKTEPVVAWMPARGGEIRDVSATETGCNPGWSSNRHLWVSRKRAGHLAWVEVDVDTGGETGRTTPGQKDCVDGLPDPASPVHPDLRVLVRKRTQIRLVPTNGLTQRDDNATGR